MLKLSILISICLVGTLATSLDEYQPDSCNSSLHEILHHFSHLIHCELHDSNSTCAQQVSLSIVFLLYDKILTFKRY